MEGWPIEELDDMKVYFMKRDESEQECVVWGTGVIVPLVILVLLK